MPTFSNPLDAAKSAIRSGSARAPTLQLAILLRDASENKLSSIDRFLEGAQNFDDYFYENFSGFGEHRTHDKFDPDQLASYYGPANFPYLASGLAMVWDSKEATRDQKDKALQLQTNLLTKYLGLFKKDGLFIDESPVYKSASQYDNMLAILSLLPFVDPKKNATCKEKSLGILAQEGPQKPADTNLTTLTNPAAENHRLGQ